MTEGIADKSLLSQLLRQYNEFPDQRAEVVAEIERRFRRNVAIMALDSAGFTRTTQVSGIIHFLASLERLARVVTPAVQRRDGRLMKQEADNLFALFPTADAALACAVAIRQHVTVANELLPTADEIYFSIGIGFGSLLVIDEIDVFGDQMNLACKLGEDLAQKGEILLTQEAYDSLQNKGAGFEERSFRVSGIAVTAYAALD